MRTSPPLAFEPQWINSAGSGLQPPQANGKGEVLLVGGMDGITEYSFTSKDAQHAPPLGAALLNEAKTLAC